MGKYIKQSIAYTLVVALLFSFFAGVPVNAEATVYTTADGYSYTVDANGNATITGYTGSATELIIPGTLGGYPVTVIGDDAFFYNQKLTSVIIPEGIVSINESAFEYCEKLSEVRLPSSLKTIGYRSFYFANISSLTIPNGVESIGAKSFWGCDFASLIVPESVKSIGESAFCECNCLIEVKLPSTLTIIADGLFEDCDKLEKVEIPASVTSIDAGAFCTCPLLKELIIPPSVTSVGEPLFYDCSPSLVVCYPEGLLSDEDIVGTGVSYTVNTDGTASVKVEKVGTVPDGENAIPIPGSIMGNEVTKVEVVDGVDAAVVKLVVPFTITGQPVNVNSTYGNAEEQKLTVGVTKTTGNEMVTYQWYEGAVAISGATSENYVIPPNKPVGTYTYYCEVTSGDYNLKTTTAAVTVSPKPITVQMDSYTRVVGTDNPVFTYTVPVGALVAGDTTDAWVANITTTATKDSPVGEYVITGTITAQNYAVTATDGVLTIVKKAPKKGEKIQDKDNKAVYKVTKAGNIDGRVGTVEYTKPVKKSAKTVTIPATITVDGVKYKVTSIAKNSFKNNKKITKVTIGKYVKTIGANAFYKCTKLKTVTLGKSVATIKDKAFYKCTAMTKITLPSKVAKIGKQAFYGCKKLKTITVKTKKLTTKKVGSKAFSKIHSKATIKVPKSKYKAYKTLFKKKGAGKKTVYKKI